jgi:hypothetical protein
MTPVAQRDQQPSSCYAGQAAIDEVSSFVTVTEPDVVPVSFVPFVRATVAELDEPAVMAPDSVQPENVTVA